VPEQAADWNGRALARSRGGVSVVCDFGDNLIRDDRQPWPPPPVVQKLCRQSRAFDGEELAAATRVLGFYSDLQSLNSEDAITWSYFAPFLAETPESRAAFLNWLLEEVGLGELAGSERCGIDLWRRIPHPDRPTSSGGPELDVVLDGDLAVVFCEAKWRSKEATSQGISGTKTQLQLRRDFLDVIGPRVYGDRGFVVCGVVLDDPLAVEPPDAHGVYTASVTWDQLARYGRHPAGDEFARYLAWKRSFLDEGAGSARPGLPVLGVDGYAGGWVSVELDGSGGASVRTAPQLADLLDAEVGVVAVDIPIGIPEGAARAADVEARRFVGARGSVFTTPPRAALLAETFAEANLVARELTGKGLSQQSFALRNRILEVEALAEADERIVEVHPEVSFCELAGQQLAHSKHKPEGLTERRDLLEREGITLPPAPLGVPEADLLDAAVAAWTAARFARGEARPPAGRARGTDRGYLGVTARQCCLVGCHFAPLGPLKDDDPGRTVTYAGTS
jgi:predicted RNase H-like nuclease